MKPLKMNGSILVRNTDYLLVSMRELAKELLQPFVSESMEIFMAWPKSFAADPAHTWLRDLININ